jgi:TRAP-type C4-dicarboxylate transport system permease small subunit
MGELYRSGEHIRVDLLEKLLPDRAARVLNLVVDAIVLALSAVVTYYAVILTGRSVFKYTAILKIRYCYIDAALVIGL